MSEPDIRHTPMEGIQILGPPGLQGPPGPPGANGNSNSAVNIFIVIGIVLLLASLFLSQIFAWGEVSALRRRVDQFAAVQLGQEAEQNCLALYRNDVSVALGLAVAANNNLWISVAGRPLAQTDEERASQAEDNVRLGEELRLSNQPLINASTALADYDRIEPPPDECPHPIAVAQRNQQVKGD